MSRSRVRPAHVADDGGVLARSGAARCGACPTGLVRPYVGRCTSSWKVPNSRSQHDQDAAVVAVEVERVAAVVHPVVRRGVEHQLDRPPQPVDVLGVHEELVDEADREAGEHQPRRHAEQRQRQPHHDLGGVVPLLPQRGGEVEVLARVVRLVGRPDDAHAVRDPVLEVEQQVDAEDRDHPGGPVGAGRGARGDVGPEGGVPDQRQELPRRHGQRSRPRPSRCWQPRRGAA